jgi:hypothetical protein
VILHQEGKNDVVIPAMASHWIPKGGARVSEIGCSKSSGNITKSRAALLQGGEDVVIIKYLNVDSKFHAMIKFYQLVMF